MIVLVASYEPDEAGRRTTQEQPLRRIQGWSNSTPSRLVSFPLWPHGVTE